MTVQTDQWVRKAEADYDVVLLLRRSRKPSRFDAIRFYVHSHNPSTYPPDPSRNHPSSCA